MNLIGHNFIAKKVLGRYNSLVAAGCHLPDMVPFLKDSLLTFNEIHEGPNTIYNYLKKNDQKSIDLALGLMTHSVKFGADKFNKDIDVWLLRSNEKLKTKVAERIIKTSGVDLKTALGPRMHNYLWCGIDFYILDKYPDFIVELNTAYKEINIPEISEILSKAFQKPLETVQNNVEKQLGLVVKHHISSKKDFVSFWKEFVSELPENDSIDVNEVVNTINFIEGLFDEQWKAINDRVVADIRTRMSSYL